MKHYFSPTIASQFGVTQAILLDNIYHWIGINKKNSTNFHDGKYWTYNSISSFCEYFPYLTYNKIAWALKVLVEKKVLITGNFNKMGFDKTRWYSFSDKALSMMENQGIDTTDFHDGYIENDIMDTSENRYPYTENQSPIPVSTTDSTTDNTSVSTVSAYSENYINLDKKPPITHKPTIKIHKIPTETELTDFINQNNLNVNSDKFINYYSQKDWKTITGNIIDWQAALKFWHKSEKKPASELKNEKPTHDMCSNKKPLEQWEIDYLAECKKDIEKLKQQNE